MNAPMREIAPMLDLARRALANAHAPYSCFRVGACLRTASGQLHAGANVENASYGLTLCAECGLVSELVRSGGGRLVAVSCVNGSGEPISPCGRCRQLLFEHGGPSCQVELADRVWSLGELLPDAFGPDDLT
jgi:cytidine deaminase